MQPQSSSTSPAPGTAPVSPPELRDAARSRRHLAETALLGPPRRPAARWRRWRPARMRSAISAATVALRPHRPPRGRDRNPPARHTELIESPRQCPGPRSACAAQLRVTPGTSAGGVSITTATKWSGAPACGSYTASFPGHPQPTGTQLDRSCRRDLDQLVLRPGDLRVARPEAMACRSQPSRDIAGTLRAGRPAPPARGPTLVGPAVRCRRLTTAPGRHPRSSGG